MVAAAAMLYAWSKAGHEFDEVQARIENLRARCHVACQEAAKPSIATQLYQIAWAKTWPDLKAKLAEGYVDTTFHNYLQERLWLDSFDRGAFSEG
jgi:hypothetical protein